MPCRICGGGHPWTPCPVAMKQINEALNEPEPAASTRKPAIRSAAVKQYWLDHYSPGGFCMVCGNWGFIDTRFTLRTPAGQSCGGLTYCFCPNGQIMRKKKTDLNQQVRRKQDREFRDDVNV